MNQQDIPNIVIKINDSDVQQKIKNFNTRLESAKKIWNRKKSPLITKFTINLGIIITKFGINLVNRYKLTNFATENPKTTDMIERLLQQRLTNAYRRKKVIVVLGPRQVGKSTLLDALSAGKQNVRNLNCDNEDERLLLQGRTSTELRQLVSPYDFFLIDEAQRVKNIGLTLKMIGDLKLQTQVIVTGSSSFDLADEINEPATGRLLNYNLFPFSLPELAAATSRLDEQRLLELRMIYGLYPEVVNEPEVARETLINLTNNYLYKDLLTFRGIRKPEIIINLVRALALQIGSEVSYNELSSLIGIDKITVENYINLLEKCFIVFRLNSFSRNVRNEIKKGKKVYFYDNGIRNAVLSNFAPLEMRSDTGALWENLMISERIKRNAYCGSYAQLFFWRTHDQKEIDLIEESDGRLTAFEFKWNNRKKTKVPKTFAEMYPNHSFNTVRRDTFWDFLS